MRRFRSPMGSTIRGSFPFNQPHMRPAMRMPMQQAMMGMPFCGPMAPSGMPFDAMDEAYSNEMQMAIPMQMGMQMAPSMSMPMNMQMPVRPASPMFASRPMFSGHRPRAQFQSPLSAPPHKRPMLEISQRSSPAIPPAPSTAHEPPALSAAPAEPKVNLEDPSFPPSLKAVLMSMHCGLCNKSFERNRVAIAHYNSPTHQKLLTERGVKVEVFWPAGFEPKATKFVSASGTPNSTHSSAPAAIKDEIKPTVDPTSNKVEAAGAATPADAPAAPKEPYGECTMCGCKFSTAQVAEHHFKGMWHSFNLERIAKGKPALKNKSSAIREAKEREKALTIAGQSAFGPRASQMAMRAPFVPAMRMNPNMARMPMPSMPYTPFPMNMPFRPPMPHSGIGAVGEIGPMESFDDGQNFGNGQLTEQDLVEEEGLGEGEDGAGAPSFQMGPSGNLPNPFSTMTIMPGAFSGVASASGPGIGMSSAAAAALGFTGDMPQMPFGFSLGVGANNAAMDMRMRMPIASARGRGHAMQSFHAVPPSFSAGAKVNRFKKPTPLLGSPKRAGVASTAILRGAKVFGRGRGKPLIDAGRGGFGKMKRGGGPSSSESFSSDPWPATRYTLDSLPPELRPYATSNLMGFFCKVCKVRANSTQQLHLHLDSKKHRDTAKHAGLNFSNFELSGNMNMNMNMPVRSASAGRGGGRGRNGTGSSVQVAGMQIKSAGPLGFQFTGFVPQISGKNYTAFD